MKCHSLCCIIINVLANCGCGEIGRRTGLRSQRLTACGFESLHPHHFGNPFEVFELLVLESIRNDCFFYNTLCSALFQALKYNNNIHFDYIKRIQHRLYSKGNNLLSYGLKLVPYDSNAIELKNLVNYLISTKK